MSAFHVIRQPHAYRIFGCDPQMSEKLGPLHEATVEQHEELVTACRMGDTSRIRKLLRLNVPVLPIYARADPLREAIRHHQRDVLFLLLSAGAPLSSRQGSCITPLEAAHTQQGLPACFPAIMRKVMRLCETYLLLSS